MEPGTGLADAAALRALFEALALYTVLGAIRHRKNLHIQKVCATAVDAGCRANSSWDARDQAQAPALEPSRSGSEGDA